MGQTIDAVGAAFPLATPLRLVVLALAVLLSACVSGSLSGSDKTHWSCYEPARAKQTGGAPHRFNDDGSHICTKSELDAEGISPSERPADQR